MYGYSNGEKAYTHKDSRIYNAAFLCHVPHNKFSKFFAYTNKRSLYMKNTYIKSIDQPLTFYECLQLLEQLIQSKMLQQDPNNRNNVLIYREAGVSSPEGWYSENIHSVAGELMSDLPGQTFLRQALVDNGISMEFEYFDKHNIISAFADDYDPQSEIDI